MKLYFEHKFTVTQYNYNIYEYLPTNYSYLTTLKILHEIMNIICLNIIHINNK